MKTIKLMVFCLIIASIQSPIIGNENMPFYSAQYPQPDTFTEDTSIITVLDYGATGDGITYDTAAIQAAIQACKPQGGTVLFPKGTYRIGSSITLDENVRFVNKAKLSIDSGITVTISGVIDASMHQIFSGAGNVSLTAGSCEYVLPQWWGAVGDGSTNCTSAFNAAVAAAGNVGRVRVSTGTWKISSPINQWPSGAFAYMQSGIIIEGNGAYSELKYTGTSGYCLDVTPADQLDSNIPCGNVIQDLHMSAPNIADPDDGGCIALTGADGFVNRVSIDDANDATGIAVKPRSVNQSVSSMTNDTDRDLTSTGVGTTERYAFKFTTQSKCNSIAEITVRMGKTGAPAGTCYMEIWTDVAGAPGAQTGNDSNAVTNTALSADADGADQKFTWYHKTKPVASASTTYWGVIRTSGYTYADGVTEVRVRVDAGDGGADEFATYDFVGGTWSTSNDGVNHAVMAHFGQALSHYISQCHMYGGTKVARGLWLDGYSSVATISDSFLACKEGIRAYRGWLMASGVYVYCTDNSKYGLHLDQSIASFTNGWLECAGGLFFGGSHENSYTITNNALATWVYWDEGVGLKMNNNTRDIFISDDASMVPDNFKYKIIPMISGLWLTNNGTIVADADAMNGNAMEIDTRYDYIGLEFRYAGNGWLTQLPRGTYKLTLVMKDTNQVANDIRFYSNYYDDAWQTDYNVLLTLTADYRPYTFPLVIDSHEMNGSGNSGKRFRIYRDAIATNTVSLSHGILEYVGPDTPSAGDLVAFNTDPSDANGARRSSVLFYGRQSGHEFLPMAQIEAQHDGAVDDAKGEVDIKINTGAQGIGSLSSIKKYSTTIGTFGVNAATPSIASGNIFKTANTGVTITMLNDGIAGKTITIIFGDSNTTIDFTGTNLKGNGGADWSPAADDHMTCVYDGTNWYCDVSDNTP